MNDDINLKVQMDHIEREIKTALTPCVGKSIDVESVKQTIVRQMDNLRSQRLISDRPSPEPKVVRLWNNWSIKQKLKWYFHNKMPIIKDINENYRKAVDDYNEAAFRLGEVDQEECLPYKSYPEYLTPNPKLIYVTDIFIRPNTSIDFITMDITINP